MGAVALPPNQLQAYQVGGESDGGLQIGSGEPGVSQIDNLYHGTMILPPQAGATGTR
jgi:hypothetical protein